MLKSTVSRSIRLDIPYDAVPGIYDVRIVITDEDTGAKRVKYRDIVVI